MGFPIKASADIAQLENICFKEPTKPCPVCGWPAHANWVDIGFGAYSQQAGPYRCDSCDWVEDCAYVNPANCHSCLNVDICFKPKDPP